MDNFKLYSVILDESINRYPYLLNDLIEKSEDENGNIVYYMTCSSVDTLGNYLSAEVSAAPNGEKRRVLLRHSFVVAILEIVNQQNQPGFVR